MNRGFTGLMLGVVVAGLGLGALLASKTTPPPAQVVQAGGQFGLAGSQSNGASGASAGATPGQAGQRQGGAAPFGTVSAKDGDTATVKTQQGDLKVKLTGVSVQKTVDGTADDLKPGTTVVVMGQQGTDGTVTANSIQIRPADAATPTGGQGRAANQNGTRGQGQAQQGQAQGQAQGQGQQSQGQGQQGQNQGARPVMGTVSALSGDTLTLSGSQGETKVSVSGARIQKTVDGSADDVTVGQSVSLVGQQGSDGTFAATAIQIRPAETQGTPAANPQATPATPAKNN